MKMKLEGIVRIPQKDYLGMIMGFGFCNAPNVESFKLEKYKPQTTKQFFSSIRL